MPRGTFVILRPETNRLSNYTQMSIGEIAMILYKSKSQGIRQVKNLSLGGLAFQRSNTGFAKGSRLQLDVLMTEQGIYLHNIPFATVPAKNGGSTATSSRDNALRFVKLSTEHKDQLQQLLAHHIG